MHPYWWFGDIWGEPRKMIIHLVSLGLSWSISSSCFSNLEKHGYSSLHPNFHRSEHTSVLMEIILTYQEFPWASPLTLTQPEPLPQTGTWEPKMAHIPVDLGGGWGGVEWGVNGICTCQGWHHLAMYIGPYLQVPANALQHMTTIKSETTQGITRPQNVADGWIWMEQQQLH